MPGEISVVVRLETDGPSWHLDAEFRPNNTAVDLVSYEGGETIQIVLVESVMEKLWLLWAARNDDGKRAVVQGEHHPTKRRKPGTVAMWEYLQAYQVYAARCGGYQSAERILERGGFGYSELTSLLGHEPKSWEPR